MNIHIITQTFPPKIGGMQSLMYSISKGLISKTEEVFVYPDHYYKSKESFKIYYFPAIKFFRPFVKRFLVKNNYKKNDVVICDTWKSVFAVPKNVKYIICFAIGQEFLVKNKNKKIKLIQKAFDRCKYIVSITKFTENLLLSICKVKREKLHVIFPTFSVKAQNKKRIKNNNSPLKFLSICRIEDRKGLLETANSLISLYNQLPDFTWSIVGGGPSKKTLEETIKKSIISKNVIFEGFVSETKKSKLFSNSDLFLMPGYIAKKSVEGFGIVYTEAASYGIPSIGGIDGGAPEAIINNKTGWCVDPKNKDKLKETLLEASTNKFLREKYGKNAKKSFDEIFSGTIAFDRLNNLLKELKKQPA